MIRVIPSQVRATENIDIKNHLVDVIHTLLRHLQGHEKESS